MAKYKYAGPGPHDATMVGGGIIRPGDILDYEPDFGPSELIDDGAPLVVPVAVQRAAGIPPEATVTIAEQKAGAEPPPIPAPPATPPAPPAAPAGEEN